MEENKREQVVDTVKQMGKYYDENSYTDTTGDIDPQTIFMQDILPKITYKLRENQLEYVIPFHDAAYIVKLVYEAAEQVGKREELRQYIRKERMNKVRTNRTFIDIEDKRNRTELTKLILKAEAEGFITRDDICLSLMQQVFSSVCGSSRAGYKCSFTIPIELDYRKKSNNNFDFLEFKSHMQELEKYNPTVLEEMEETVFFNGNWEDYDYLFAIVKANLEELEIDVNEDEVKKQFVTKKDNTKTEGYYQRNKKENATKIEIRAGTSIETMIELLNVYRMAGKTVVIEFNGKKFYSCDVLDIDDVYKELYGKNKEHAIQERDEAISMSRKNYQGYLSATSVVSTAIRSGVAEEDVRRADNVQHTTEEQKNKEGEYRDDS